MAAAVGCGGTTSGVGEPDPYIATNPPSIPSAGTTGDGGNGFAGGSGGGGGFATSGTSGSSGFAQVAGSGGNGGMPIAVNPPAICPSSVPTDRRTGCNLWEHRVNLSCSYTTQACRTLVARCGSEGWNFSCQDGGGAGGAGGAAGAGGAPAIVGGAPSGESGAPPEEGGAGGAD